MSLYLAASNGLDASTLLVGILFVALVGYLSSIIYESFVSPLSKYPAPFYNHISYLPSAWHMWNGTHVFWVHRLHQKYGYVVRISPCELSYIDQQAWKDIYGYAREGRKRLAKEPRFYGRAQGQDLENGTPGIIESDDANHARIRRIFSHAFSHKAIMEQEPIFQKYTTLLIQKLKERAGEGQETFDLLAWYNYMTFDVIGDLTFGESLNLLETTTFLPWITAIFNSLQAGVILRSMRYWPVLYKTMRVVFGETLRAKRRQHTQYAAERVTKRLQKDPTHSHPDLWSLVLRQKEEEALTLKEMHTNAAAFMLAGTETSATACSGLTYLLLKHPEKMQRVVDEIRTTINSKEEITFTRMQGLPYLTACINETLRIYPPGVSGFQRRTPPEGTEICGQWVPGNTSVCVSAYACYHSERNFQNPDEFIPERFLDAKGAFANDVAAAFQPFSYGPRNCIGKNMAYNEIKAIMVKMLWNFDLRLVDEEDDWLDQQVFLVYKKKPLIVQLRPIGGEETPVSI